MDADQGAGGDIGGGDIGGGGSHMVSLAPRALYAWMAEARQWPTATTTLPRQAPRLP